MLAQFAMVPSALAQAPDSAALLRAARRAESEYEGSVRRFAPISFSEPRSGSCDEIVGRYCIYYESGGDSIPAEPGPVTTARQKAITLLEEAHGRTPGSKALSFALVRFLVQAGRADDAVVVAAKFGAVTRDTTSRHMLLGFALHAAGETTAATDELEAWLARLPSEQRIRITNLRWLLDRRERSRYDDLDGAERVTYEERAWRWADPLYLVPGNQSWTDHVARHALSRMLADRRGIANIEAWGDDLEQLTVRFGPPARTTRAWRGGALGSQEQYSDHWDPTLRTYVAPALAEALQMTARLDTVWPLDSLTARSGHTPPPIRLMRVLEHQATVFPDDTPSLVVTGVARMDSLVADRPVRAALFLLDSTLQIVGEAAARAKVDADSIVFSGEVPLPESARYYSAEVYEPHSRFAARARYLIQRPQTTAGLTVSSIQLAKPFDPGQLPADRGSPLLQTLNRPVLRADSRVGIYAEAGTPSSIPRNLEVQIENTRLDRGGGIGKVIGWLGRRVGLSSAKTPARLGWSVETNPDAPTSLPVTLDLSGSEPGRYLLTLTVRDPVTDSAATAKREFLVVKGRTSRRP